MFSLTILLLSVTNSVRTFENVSQVAVTTNAPEPRTTERSQSDEDLDQYQFKFEIGNKSEGEYCNYPDYIKTVSRRTRMTAADYFECPTTRGNIFSTEENGMMRRVIYKDSDLCLYRNPINAIQQANTIDYTEYTLLKHTLDLRWEPLGLVRVTCMDMDDKYRKEHSEVHYFVKLPVKQKVVKALSVVVLVVDLLHAPKYFTTMPKTREAFESLGKFYYFKKFSRLGLNAADNIVPLVTGLFRHEKKFAQLLDEAAHVDHLPFIWKDFRGPWTAYVSDATPFTMDTSGFLDKPTDFYTVPFWNIMNTFKDFNQESHCHRREPSIELFLRQIKRFLYKTKGKNFFIYAHSTKNLQQHYSSILDNHYARFIHQEVKSLRNAVVVLIGNTAGYNLEYAARNSGRAKFNLPLFALHVPDFMLKEHGDMHKYLTLNVNRMTTPLDVHQTLKDLALGVFSPNKDPQKSDRYSLIREEIPVNRTCEEALIMDPFCMCKQKVALNLKTPSVQEASQALVHAINKVVDQFPKCSKFKMKKVNRAWSIPQAVSYPKVILIMIQLGFSDAIVSGYLYKDAADSDWAQRGEIVRMNPPIKPPYCHAKSVTCYCKLLKFY